MRLTLPLLLGGLVALLLPPLAAPAQPARDSVHLRVRLPASAVLEIEGARTKSTGSERRFTSPPVEAGRTYVYTLRATWVEGGKEVVRERKVRVRPGQEVLVDLNVEPAEGGKAAEPGKGDKPRADGKPAKKAPVEPDVPFVPTPQEVVDKMLELARVTKDDVVYDLGCGDGRIVVTAAKKYGARGVGIDIDPERVKDSLENVKKNKVENLVEIRQGDALKADISQATVVTLYLLPQFNRKLQPALMKMKPGTRIVSHDFDVGDWKPHKTVEVTDNDGEDHTLMLWEIPDPAKKQEPKKEEVKKEEPPGRLTVPYVPTPQDVVDKMLELAGVTKDDVVYDLGCGDGRIIVTAAKKYGARGVGVDLDPARVRDSEKNIEQNKVEKLVTVRRGDVLKTDVSGATVVTLYLLPDVNRQLRPILQKQLKPGSRVVSHDFDMGDWKPDKKIEVDSKNGRTHTLYLWVIPKQ